MFDPCPECGAPWLASHYSTCTLAARKFVEQIKEDSRATAEYDPRCPKCGFATTEWHDFMSCHTGDGDTITVTCDHCDCEYAAEIVITYSFRVQAPKGEGEPA